MDEPTTLPQQQYIDMPNEMALELIHNFLQPGMPTLGMWFGWNQPSDGQSVKLGSVYGTCTSDKFYWEEVFGLKDWYHVGEPTLEDKKEFGRFMKAHKKDPRQGFNLRGIWSADEVFFPFDLLELQHKMLYRLMVMAVNTGGDYHNWAIEFGEDLACYYAERKEATCEWELYEADNNFTSEFVERFKDFVDLNIVMEERDLYPQGIVEDAVNADTVLWLEEFIASKYGQSDALYHVDFPAEASDFYFWMFGVRSNEHTWWMSDVNQVLAWFMDWMKAEWKSGNLLLTNDTPSEKLNEWLELAANSPTLPGF